MTQKIGHKWAMASGFGQKIQAMNPELRQKKGGNGSRIGTKTLEFRYENKATAAKYR